MMRSLSLPLCSRSITFSLCILDTMASNILILGQTLLVSRSWFSGFAKAYQFKYCSIILWIDLPLEAECIQLKSCLNNDLESVDSKKGSIELAEFWWLALDFMRLITYMLLSWISLTMHDNLLILSSRSFCFHFVSSIVSSV